jgi:hypothetical protein
MGFGYNCITILDLVDATLGTYSAFDEYWNRLTKVRTIFLLIFNVFLLSSV